MKNRRRLKNSPWLRYSIIALLAVCMLPLLTGAGFALPSLGSPEGLCGLAACGTVLTLLDVAKRSGNDPAIGVVEEITTVAPELSVFPARSKKGTSYKIFQRTGNPTGGFRDANSGVALTKSSGTQKLAEMFFFDLPLQVDEMIVKADGGELGDILAGEAVAAAQDTVITMGSQIWYGDNATNKGFNGLKNFLSDEVDATGSGGAYSSAYLVWLDPNHKGAYLDVGNEGEMEFKEWKLQQVNDAADATKKFMAWVSNMAFFIGLNCASDKSVWRAKKLTAAKPFTDAIGAEVLSKVPLSRRAGLRWFMNSQVQFQLQKSRSSVGAQKADSRGDTWAPIPTECCGIPITYTDSLIATETA